LRILSIDKNNFIPFWNIILISMGNGWSGGGSDGQVVVAVELVAAVEAAVEALASAAALVGAVVAVSATAAIVEVAMMVASVAAVLLWQKGMAVADKRWWRWSGDGGGGGI
jgi:hypothetical protein